MSNAPLSITSRVPDAPADVLHHLQALQDACGRWPTARPEGGVWPAPADPLLADASAWVEPFVGGLFLGAALAGVGYVAYRFTLVAVAEFLVRRALRARAVP